VLAPALGDASVLSACLQCGICAASCNLAEPGSRFPRKEMGLVQLGEWDKLAASPSIWGCYNCTDCSASCPAQASPGRVMAAIRQVALERYTWPAPLVRALTRPRWFPAVFGFPAALVLGVIALFGSLHPQQSPVLYASMFPHLALNSFFTAFSGFAAAAGLVAVHQAWLAYQGEPIWRARPHLLLGAAMDAMREIATHRRFKECEEYPLARWAHLGMLWGFAVLFGLAGLVALLLLLGLPYPLPILHPIKLVGNAAGLALLFGAAWFAGQRWRTRKTDPSNPFDWLLLGTLLTTGITGFLAEILRYADLASLAYPTYFVHLVAVFVLLCGLPFGKLAHVLHRSTALTARAYHARLEREAGATTDLPQRAAS
jgi:quinone-modifying oxidoreductase subunit QmoC